MRVHPNLKNKHIIEQERWNELGKVINQKGFYWIDHNDLEPTYLLLQKSDMIITSGSTVGIEAISLGKPSISLTKCFYDGIISEVRLCKSPEQLIDALNNTNSFTPPNKASSYIYGAWVMLNATKFRYFEHSKRGFGLMKEGVRIASAGYIQRFISWTKQLVKIDKIM